MKALATLIRLHTHQLDEKRRALAQAQDRLEHARDDLRRLEEEVVAEKRQATEVYESGLTYGAYVQAAKQRRLLIEARIAQLEQEALAALERVTEAFAELKKYEITKANREKQALEEANRVEQALLDEMGLAMHRRKQEP